MGDIRVTGRADEIGEGSGELMHAVTTGNILILIAEHVPRIALGMVTRSPMQIREEQRGVEAEFVGVGLLRIARMAVA